MEITYPRWVPNPNPRPATGKYDPAKDDTRIKVESAEEHKLRNPEHYEEMVTYRPPSATSEAETRRIAKDEELARIVKLILAYPTAKVVAKEIASYVKAIQRPLEVYEPEIGKPEKKPTPKRPAKVPTVEEVKAAGYADDAAASIVADEQGKFDRGEKPYGPNDPDSDSA